MVLVVLAVVSAAGIWFGAGGPVGRGISAGIGFVVGRGAIVLPVLLAVAGVVVAIELVTISLVRKRFMDVPLRLSLVQVALGGALIVAAGVLLGNA